MGIGAATVIPKPPILELPEWQRVVIHADHQRGYL